MTHFFRTFEQGESRRMQQPGGRKNAMILRWDSLSAIFTLNIVNNKVTIMS